MSHSSLTDKKWNRYVTIAKQQKTRLLTIMIRRVVVLIVKYTRTNNRLLRSYKLVEKLHSRIIARTNAPILSATYNPLK